MVSYTYMWNKRITEELLKACKFLEFLDIVPTFNTLVATRFVPKFKYIIRIFKFRSLPSVWFMVYEIVLNMLSKQVVVSY